MNAPACQHIAVAGAGNIGSRTLELVARLSAVARLSVIDHDAYDASNVATQAIALDDVGSSKALAQAHRLQTVRQDLRVDAWVRRVEEVPLGWWRGVDAILGCLDSLEARRVLNQVAWRLGVPSIDAGVMADLGLARVSVYLPGPEAPCYECAFSERDYARLEQRFACGGTNAAPSSGSPSFLGALAAALQVAELRKLLDGDSAALPAGSQVIYDTRQHCARVTAFRRNPACRFDHATWTVEPLGCSAGGLSLGALLASAEAEEVRLAGGHFATRLGCTACGRQIETARIASRMNGSAPSCPACGARCEPIGFHTVDALRRSALSPALLAEPLLAIGFLDGDVLHFTTAGRDHYLELGTASHV